MRKLFLLTLLLLVGTAAQARADALADLKKRFDAQVGRPYAERIETVKAIAALGTEKAARFLFDVIENDAESSMRLNTIHQVAVMPPKMVFDRLLRIVESGDSSLKSTAFHAIVYNRKEELPDRLVGNMLVSTESGLRSNTIRYLARHGDPRFIPSAEQFLRDFPRNGSSLLSILIEAKTPEAMRILLRIYDDKRRYDRDQVAAMLKAAPPEVRAVLVEGLGEGNRDRTILVATLVRRAAIAEAESALVRALPSGDPELRAILIEAIGAVGAKTDAGRAAIRTALTAEDGEVQAAAARAVRQAPSREALPLLIELLSTADRLARAEAAVSLERLTGQQYGDVQELWKRWWGEYGSEFDLTKVKLRSDRGLSQVLVDLAIERGAAALKGARGEKPPWSYASHDVGTTALVLLALHAAGCERKDKAVKAAIDYLRKASVPEKTYETSLMAMALEAVAGKKYRRKISACAKRLRETQLAEGLWGYPTGAGDNSNTQYAVLGLRAAARAGVKVPQKTWEKIRDHFLGTTSPDGGWAYTTQNRQHASCSMTAAGVTCLLVCLENMKLGDDAEEATLRAAIEKGYEALGTIMKLDKDTLYALYGVERAGVLGGRTLMAKKPWYVPGAQRLLAEQGRDGFWTGNYDKSVETAFAILFLKRATVPIGAVATR